MRPKPQQTESEVNPDVPYMPTVKNLTAILDKIQQGSVPPTFGIDFLLDLGFKSSNDRSVLKVLRFLGMIDSSGQPTQHYRDFVNPTRSRIVLASRLRASYDDLFLANQGAHDMSRQDLQGWFKTKTGKGSSVTEKVATTFKTMADYADFTKVEDVDSQEDGQNNPAGGPPETAIQPNSVTLGMAYRIEVVLPDTTNLDTYRAIFRAIKEELGS